MLQTYSVAAHSSEIGRSVGAAWTPAEVARPKPVWAYRRLPSGSCRCSIVSSIDRAPAGSIKHNGTRKCA